MRPPAEVRPSAHRVWRRVPERDCFAQGRAEAVEVDKAAARSASCSSSSWCSWCVLRSVQVRSGKPPRTAPRAELIGERARIAMAAPCQGGRARDDEGDPLCRGARRRRGRASSGTERATAWVPRATGPLALFAGGVDHPVARTPRGRSARTTA